MKVQLGGSLLGGSCLGDAPVKSGRLLGWLLCKLLKGRRDRNTKIPRYFMFFTKTRGPAAERRRRRAAAGGILFSSCLPAQRKNLAIFLPSRQMLLGGSAGRLLAGRLLPRRCSCDVRLGGSLLGDSFLGDAPARLSCERLLGWLLCKFLGEEQGRSLQPWLPASHFTACPFMSCMKAA